MKTKQPASRAPPRAKRVRPAATRRTPRKSAPSGAAAGRVSDGRAKRAAPRATPAAAESSTGPADAPAPRVLPFEIDPARLEASLAQLRTNVTRWARKGRSTKVRFKFRGKQLLPDLPLAAVVAAEGLTFYWTGILRALVFNLAGRTLLDVELVNDSERRLAEGKAALLAGELDEALKAFEDAERMDHDNPRVLLSLGAALKLKGRRDAARAALERARAADPDGPTAAEAARLLGTLTADAPERPNPG